MNKKIVFAWLLVSLTALGALAQSSTTATIRGKVMNERGSALPAAEIDAVNTATGFVKTVQAGSDGSYVLQGLVPGTYTVVIAAPGYEPRNETITVLVGQSLTADFRMTGTAVVNESITVVGTQAVETKTTEVATNVTTQQIESLPQDDRNFLNFAALAPGVRVSLDPLRKTFTGDAQNAEQTNVFIDGVSNKNDVLQGGLAGQDTSRGNPFPQNAVQEFRVITQNYGAQYDHASSAIITAVTKSGGNTFDGQTFLYYQPKNWVAPTKKSFQFSTLATNATYHRTQPGLNFGGPIVKDKLHFFTAWEGVDEHATSQVSLGLTDPAFVSQFGSELGVFPGPFRSNLGFGKVSWQIDKSQIADFSGSYRHEREIRDFGSARSYQAANEIVNEVYGVTGRHQWNNASALNEAILSVQKYNWNQQPLNPDVVGRLYFNPQFVTILRTGGGDTTQQFNQRRVELRDNFNFAPLERAGGTHNFQIGGNVDFMHYDVNKNLFGNPLYKFLPDANNQFGNIPFEAQFGIGNPKLGLSNREYGIYGQDNWTVNNKLTLNIGLRWDYETHMLDEDFVTPANIVSALKGKTFVFEGRNITIPDAYFSTGTERKPYKNEYQPRLGFSYDLRGDSRSVLFGGYGKYYDRIFLNSTLDERFRQQFPVYTFRFSPTGDPANHVIKWDPSYFTPEGLRALIAAGNTTPEVYLLNNNTKPPYSKQWNIGYRQTFGDWLGTLNYSNVNARRGLTWVAASGFDFGALGGLGFELLSDPQGRSNWYTGESIAIDRPYNAQTHWGLHFTYTHAVAEQNGNDLFEFDLPRVSQIARHPVEGSEPNRWFVSGIFGLPWDVRFSTNITLSSGGAKPIQDFSKGFDFAGRLATGVWNGAVYPQGSGSFGYRDVSLRLEKQFALVHGTSLAVIADMFNATNSTNYGCLNNFLPANPSPQDLANIGVPNCVVSLGRREQIGLRLNF